MGKWSVKPGLGLWLILGLAPVAVADDAPLGPQFPTLNAIGFGSFSYKNQGDEFALGQMVGHVIGQLDANTAVFGEFTVTEKNGKFSTAVERLIVRYDFSDLVKISVGKYHTPVGYWNTAFHHGVWLQTTIKRPQSYRFGSSVVPIHFKGISLQGNTILSDHVIGYRVGYGQGVHQNLGGDHQSHSTSKNAHNIDIFFRPATLPELKIGVSYHGDKITTDGQPGMPGSQYIRNKLFAAYFALEGETPEIIGEYFHYTHRELFGARRSSSGDAFYIQAAYALDENFYYLKPYIRLDQVKAQGQDVLVEKDQNFKGYTLGVRSDFSDFAALKVEYRHEKFENRRVDNILAIQISFMIQ